MEDDITEDYNVCMDNGLGLVVHLLVFLLDLPASIHQAKNKQMENDCQFCRDVLSVQDANVCMVSAKHYKCFVFARPWKHNFFF